MVTETVLRPITADEFLEMDFGENIRLELEAGVIKAMGGGTRAHSRVMVNCIILLGNKLSGRGCRPYNSEIGIRIDEYTVRYPEVSVYCGRESTPENDNLKTITDPVLLIEILSPSTKHTDQNRKLAEYQSLASVEAVLFIDPVAQSIRRIERLGPASWRDDVLEPTQDLALAALDITLSRAEIFSRD